MSMSLLYKTYLTDLQHIPDTKSTRPFLTQINRTMTSDIPHLLASTRLSILIEGFYGSLPENETPLKKSILAIRLNRWTNHFGTPTVPFLLTFSREINETSYWFKRTDNPTLNKMPWEIDNQPTYSIDFQNDLLVDISSLERINMPNEDEKTGQFLKTHNPSGGYTLPPCDLISEKFLTFAKEIAKKKGRVLEIGSGFGAASQQALSNGALVYSNDIDAANLAVLRRRVKSHPISPTGDNDQLTLLPGSFPEELIALPNDYFDAVLICRVLHFFTGKRIEQSIRLLTNCLKPDGKLYIVCETPFLKNWERFIPEYENRIQEGWPWPGEIHNPADYESSGRAASLPKLVHWMTKETLATTLEKSRLSLDYLSYLDRKGQFPDDLLLNGRESVGAIASKSNRRPPPLTRVNANSTKRSS